jgi:hypothetical protein
MPIIRWEEQDGNGNVLASGSYEQPYLPLSGYQVVAALNAVLGIWTLVDAANVAGVESAHLIAEAEAWAVASEVNNV